MEGLPDEPTMTGSIAPFEDFVAMDEKVILQYDIVVGPLIGKKEMGGRQVQSVRKDRLR